MDGGETAPINKEPKPSKAAVKRATDSYNDNETSTTSHEPRGGGVKILSDRQLAIALQVKSTHQQRKRD